MTSSTDKGIPSPSELELEAGDDDRQHHGDHDHRGDEREHGMTGPGRDIVVIVPAPVPEVRVVRIPGGWSHRSTHVAQGTPLPHAT